MALAPKQADALLDWCEAPLKNGATKPQQFSHSGRRSANVGLRSGKSEALSDSEQENSEESDDESPTEDFAQGVP
jgi:hypothetical protein